MQKAKIKCKKDKMYVSKVAIEFMPSKIQGRNGRAVVAEAAQKSNIQTKAIRNTCNYIVRASI